MRRFCAMLTLLSVAALAPQPILAGAASSARMIPAGAVTVLKDGKPVSRFRSEMPLSEGSLLITSGNCVVQSQALQLLAYDKALFGLKQGNSQTDLTVKMGRVDFALRQNVKSISFHTPAETIRASITSGSLGADGLVRGSIVVSDKGTELSVQQGSLKVASSKGAHLAEPGKSLVLAQSKVTPEDEAMAAAAIGGTAAGGATAAAGSTAGASGLSTGAAAAGVAGIAAGAAASGSGGSTSGNPGAPVVNPVSPF